MCTTDREATLNRYIIWLPLVLGALFVVVSFVDVALFEIDRISPSQMLLNELVVFSLGVLSVIYVFCYAVASAFKRRWQQLWIAIFNIMAYLILFFVGAYNGMALLYAT